VHRAQDPLKAVAGRASEGDPEAIRELVMELGGQMLRTVRKVLGGPHPDAEDVTQEAVLSFISALRGFRGDCSVAHFARQVALRRALHARRHFRVRDKVGDQELDADHCTYSGDVSPLDTAISRERRAVVFSLLDQLPQATAEALALHFMFGYTVAEIAMTLGVPPDTVWSRLKLGKQALRKALAQSERLSDLLLNDPSRRRLS
jgi:RNA polymerase sigma factor (sigma-70 family)